MKKGIKVKILIFLLLISMIPLSVVGYSRYMDTKWLILEREQNKIKEFHKNIEGKIVKFFGGAQKDILFLKELAKEELEFSENEQHSKDHLDILQSAFYHFARVNIQYDKIRLINKEGYEIIRINNEEGVAKIVPREQLQYKGDRYYIQEAYDLEEGEMYVSFLDLNRKNGKIETPANPMIRYVMPIYDHKDDLKGFIMLSLKVKYILKDIERVKDRSKYKNLMIFDENGYYIMHPDKRKEWGGYTNYNTGESFKKDYPQKYKEILSSNSLKIIKTNEDLLSFSPIKILKDMDKKIFVVLYLDKKEYLMPLTKFIKKLILEMFVILVLVIVAGLYISEHLSKPILEIIKAVEEIGKGNFDINFNIQTSDEIACLGYEIKKMSYELKNMYHNMERLVKERTEKLELAHLEMKEMANTDSLTGLYNRHYFNQFIQEEEKRIAAKKGNLTICIIDVDKFKYINDFYGHNIGDEVLKAVAKILKDSAKKTDVVVRYGGDEFLIVLPNSDQKSTNNFIDRLYDKLKEWNQNTDLLNHELSLSIGFEEYNGEGSILDTIKIADERMYENKKQKRQIQ
ncbi:sensor domain-containing diguanylate cyclase [Crassaminicella thermophila]|nr:sensor domain-containing diguanylate cyclase [Crassaminicella thermophila]